MVSVLFRSLRRAVDDASVDHEGIDPRDYVVSARFLAVASVEAFINIYFRVLVDDAEYRIHRDRVTADLQRSSNANPRSLDYKLRNWFPQVLGKALNWQAGVAADFDRLREWRNSLMHFSSGHETLDVAGHRFHGLANTECYDDLRPQDAQDALHTARGMVRETLRLRGVAPANIPGHVHLWTGEVAR